MLDEANTWTLVLAAGEGSRLRSLTTCPCGTAIPKQFCCLFDGPSLLEEALQRARAVSNDAHACVIVADQHRRWWDGVLGSLPAANVIVQPENRGTANGMLFPLLNILVRDPQARIMLLPSDHHVRQEALLASALREAVKQLQWRSGQTLLLGLEPEEADPELGYIIPGERDGRGALTVTRFIEKPPAARACELIRAGGLWNAFILISTAQALLAMFQRRIPQIVEAMRAAIQHDGGTGTSGAEVPALYQRLPIIDFSRDIVPGQESSLRVVPVPPCGWSDLGTPKRVEDAVRAAPARASIKARHAAATGMKRLSLAAQHSLRSLGHGG